MNADCGVSRPCQTACKSASAGGRIGRGAALRNMNRTGAPSCQRQATYARTMQAARIMPACRLVSAGRRACVRVRASTSVGKSLRLFSPSKVTCKQPAHAACCGVIPAPRNITIQQLHRFAAPLMLMECCAGEPVPEGGAAARGWLP